MTSKKNKIVCFLIALIIPLHLYSLDFTESTFNRIEQWTETNLIEGKIPGLALAISRDGKSLFTEFSGVASPDSHYIDGTTQFYIGSLTKAFTAVAIVQLADSGRLNLDESVGTYLPDRLDDQISLITIRQLLSHSGGIRAKDGMRFEKTLADRDFSEWDIYSRLQRDSSSAGRFEYSNMNYNLLGLVIERVSGLEFEAYVKRYILEPLGMNRTITSPELATNLSKGYRLWFDKPMYLPMRRYDNYLPAMGYISCLDDLLLFSDFLINNHDRGTYLGKTMFQPVVESSFCGVEGMYTLSWQTGEIEGTAIALIQGGTQGSHNYIYLLPDERIGIILLTNMNSIFQTDHTKNLIPGIIRILNGNRPDTVEPGRMTEMLYAVLIFFLSVSIVLYKKGSLFLHFLITMFILSLMFIFMPSLWNITFSAMKMIRLDLYILMMTEALLLVLFLLIRGYGHLKKRSVKSLRKSLRLNPESLYKHP